MEYTITKIIPKDRAEKIHELENITGEQAYEKFGMKEDDVTFESVVFEDGSEVEIDLVIPSNESYTWTQWVLFDIGNEEVACTEPSDLFFGEWILVNNRTNNKYTVIIKEGE